ncbi:MAG: methyl-accepting chemotaxis protein [Hylemonella sp.]|uniref:methyl-accepting chemotaxis protein n=1 Tax=Hylemonella sp. TaxID=2066020 RepID=UPI0022BD156B|nr:methyl-accepting chemotaxis protein [Hylemonella sp.]MCZ8253535.1 methyl-accepting chemotaxis protein [Hylemonella sp.]
MRFKDVKIGTKLVGGFIVVLCLAAAQTLYAVYGTSTLNSNASLIADRWLPGTRHAGILGTQVSLLRAAQFQHVLTFGEDERRALEKQMDDMGGSINKELQSLAEVFSSGPEQQALSALQSGWKQYQAQQAEIVGLARQRRDEEALDILKGPALQTFSGLTTQLRALGKIAQDGGLAASEESATIQNRVFYGNLGALVITIVLGLLIARTLNRTIAGGISYAAQLTRKVAQGDLSARITPNTGDEIGQLLHAVRDMQDALTRLVNQVRQGSDAVSNASAEIATGNNDLSARTESQASALQQTAASMEELSSTVKQNADNARQANQLAQSASTVAVQGGEVVAQVVDTMKGINDSARKIHDIISVIDGIAFQTNILALNAAVEAARAGEQGRGFAVVASEVRSLAGRSAEAAKEIKTLITDSVERVGRGTALVDQAGSTMNEVVASIKRVTDIMGEISAASSEQSQGVAQVGEAITSMDQTTQQNAALVEEMAAAASSLKSQAQELVQTVAVFRLGGDTARAAPTAAAPKAPPTPTVRAPAPKPAPAATQRLSAPAALAPAKAPAKSAGADDGEWESF